MAVRARRLYAGELHAFRDGEVQPLRVEQSPSLRRRERRRRESVHRQQQLLVHHRYFSQAGQRTQPQGTLEEVLRHGLATRRFPDRPPTFLSTYSRMYLLPR